MTSNRRAKLVSLAAALVTTGAVALQGCSDDPAPATTPAHDGGGLDGTTGTKDSGGNPNEDSGPTDDAPSGTDGAMEAAPPGDAGDAGDAGPAADPKKAVQISVGDDYTCAVMQDGKVRCWGVGAGAVLGGISNPDGGEPDFSDRTAPSVPVESLDNAIQVSAGIISACAVKKDHTVSCWGASTHGELGAATGTHWQAVAIPNLTNVAKVSSGRRHNCALKTDGSVVCWGYNFTGQLGNGTAFNDPDAAAPGFTTVPLAVLNVAGATDVRAGYRNSFFLLGDGGVLGAGSNDYLLLARPDFDGGSGSTSFEATPHFVQGLPLGATRLGECVSTSQCAILSDKGVACWGSNSNSQLGQADAASLSAVPVRVANVANAIQVATGDIHGCAVTTAGDLYCWGSNASGESGQPDDAGTLLPVAQKVPGLANVIQVGTGADDPSHTCALTSAGDVYCFGNNVYGKLGRGKLPADLPLDFHPVKVQF